MIDFTNIFKERIIIITGLFFMILLYYLRNYSIFSKYRELYMNLVLPVVCIIDAFYSKLWLNGNRRQNNSPSSNNTAQDEVRQLNSIASDRYSDPSLRNDNIYKNDISRNYQTYKK